MKTKVTLFLLLTAFIFSACHDDDDYKPNDTVLSSFNQTFPDAKKVDWKRLYQFEVADFIYENVDMEAWYSSDGKLMMKITELAFADLPTTVQNSFTHSIYSTWKIDDVEKIERTSEPALYRIDIDNEADNREVTLYYEETGTLIQEVIDSDHSATVNLPIPQAIKDYVTTNYPAASIYDVDIDHGNWEIDIWDGDASIDRELLFDNQYQWISTHWSVAYENLPQEVRTALTAKGYSEADSLYILSQYYTTHDNGNYYLIEIDETDPDIIFKFREDGTLIS